MSERWGNRYLFVPLHLSLLGPGTQFFSFICSLPCPSIPAPWILDWPLSCKDRPLRFCTVPSLDSGTQLCTNIASSPAALVSDIPPAHVHWGAELTGATHLRTSFWLWEIRVKTSGGGSAFIQMGPAKLGSPPSKITKPVSHEWEGIGGYFIELSCWP